MVVVTVATFAMIFPHKLLFKETGHWPVIKTDNPILEYSN